MARDNVLQSQAMWLILADVACLVLAVVLGVELRRALGGVLTPLPVSVGSYFIGHLDGWIYFCGGIIVANYVVGSYGIQVTTSRFTLLVNWAVSLLVALVIVSITSYAWFELLVGRGVLAMLIVAYAGLSLCAKGLLYGFIFRSSAFVCRVAIFGIGERAMELHRIVESGQVQPTHRVCAYIIPTDIAVTGNTQGAPTLNGVAVMNGSEGTIEDIVSSLNVNVLMVALESVVVTTGYQSALRRIRFGGVEVLDFLSASEIYSGRIPLSLVDEGWLMHASRQPSLANVTRFKRIFDMVVGAVGLVVCAPIALLTAIVIKASAPNSLVIFTQTRAGLFGQPFRMYKFRTMIEDAEKTGGAVWSLANDPRVTRVGRVLRRIRFDEIPQLVNVICGKMSLVGPRPERPELIGELERRIPFFRERENVLPGLTGWAQVQYPYADTVESFAKKLEFDLYYIKNLSLRLDVQIVLRTVRIILFGKERSI